MCATIKLLFSCRKFAWFFFPKKKTKVVTSEQYKIVGVKFVKSKP